MGSSPMIISRRTSTKCVRGQDARDEVDRDIFDNYVNQYFNSEEVFEFTGVGSFDSETEHFAAVVKYIQHKHGWTDERVAKHSTGYYD